MVLPGSRTLGAFGLLLVLTLMVQGVAGSWSSVSGQDATPAAAPADSLGWYDDFAVDNDKLNVATTVAPVSSIVRNIGGTRIDLYGIVPDGVNSHTFEPAPSDAAILSRADLVIVNGLELAELTIALAEANLKEGAVVYRLGEGMITEEEYAYDFSFPEDGGKPNPHLWVNVPFAQRYAELTAGWLSERDPANADYYAENLRRYNGLLTSLDAAIMAAVQTTPEGNRKLVTYHDSYAYFARQYGMTVVGAIQPSDFSEPSARDVAQLIEQIREEEVPAVFGSEVFPSDVLEQVADETDAVYIDQLRDDAPPGDPNAPEHTYVGMMLRNMDLMVPAHGGTVDSLVGIMPYDTYVS